VRMIMRIIHPDSGSIRVFGEERHEAYTERIGYLPEERGLYKTMRVRDLLRFYGRLKNGRDVYREVDRWLERLDLAAWANKKIEQLSKGMSQKVQILGTLVHEPELVILDEPFSGLDPVNAELMRDVILAMKKEGKTVIFSTHIMEQAEQICDYIFLINKGRKVLDGPLAAVKAGGDCGILLDYDGDGGILKTLPGLRRLNDSGKQAEMFFEEGVDPQDVLARLVGRLSIRRFDLREPSLHEIFIRAVGGKSDE